MPTETSKKIGYLEQQQVSHGERLLRLEDEKKTLFESIGNLQTGQNDIRLAMAVLPTKQDFQEFIKEVRDCRETDRRETDTKIGELRRRDMYGTLGVGLVAVVAGVIAWFKGN